jgi:hypothetical protein
VFQLPSAKPKQKFKKEQSLTKLEHPSGGVHSLANAKLVVDAVWLATSIIFQKATLPDR